MSTRAPLRRVLRDRLAAGFRALPRVPALLRWGPRLGRLLTDWSSNEDCLVSFTLRDGSKVRVNLRAETSSFWTGEYDRAVIERLARCLGPGGVALDVGANCGMWTVQLGRRLASLGGRLYAFEPVPSNFALLQEGVEANGLRTTVRAYQVALGDHEGEVVMRLEVFPSGNAFLLGDQEAAAAADVRVPLTTLDALAALEGIARCDLVKLDVEGAELQCLQGGAGFLREHMPVVFGEFDAARMRRFGHSLAGVFDLCAPWGYLFFRQRPDGTFAPLPRPEEPVEGILMVPKDAGMELRRVLGIEEG